MTDVLELHPRPVGAPPVESAHAHLNNALGIATVLLDEALHFEQHDPNELLQAIAAMRNRIEAAQDILLRVKLAAAQAHDAPTQANRSIALARCRQWL